MNMYIGNLSYQVSEADLENLFSGFGEVVSVKIIKDRDTGKSKGFGFIEMENNSDANSSIDELNGSTFMERQIVVNEARPRPQKRKNNRY